MPAGDAIRPEKPELFMAKKHWTSTAISLKFPQPYEK